MLQIQLNSLLVDNNRSPPPKQNRLLPLAVSKAFVLLSLSLKANVLQKLNSVGRAKKSDTKNEIRYLTLFVRLSLLKTTQRRVRWR